MKEGREWEGTGVTGVGGRGKVYRLLKQLSFVSCYRRCGGVSLKRLGVDEKKVSTEKPTG